MVKDLMKQIGYRFLFKNVLKEHVMTLGYVFHTEEIFDESIFDNLLHFCKEYRRLTNAGPICALMTPLNPRVREGMRVHKISGDEFGRRVRLLSQHASIGYHGHFWFEPDEFRNGAAEIRCTNFLRSSVETQVDEEVQWFQSTNIRHGNFYAPGWWFMNAELLAILRRNNFDVDLSFSKSLWFYNAYSHTIMRRHNIRTGEPFILETEHGEVICIQNFIGCHPTKFVQDFDRNFSSLLDPGYREIIGVVNAHDKDLMAADFIENTLNCLSYLQEQYKARLVSYDNLVAQARCQAVKRLSSV